VFEDYTDDDDDDDDDGIMAITPDRQLWLLLSNTIQRTKHYFLMFLD